MFFIHNKESEVFEFHRLADQFMCADKNVYFTTFKIRQSLSLLLGCAKSIDIVYCYGKTFQPFGEGFEVLEGKNSGRHKHGDLFAIWGSGVFMLVEHA